MEKREEKQNTPTKQLHYALFHSHFGFFLCFQTPVKKREKLPNARKTLENCSILHYALFFSRFCLYFCLTKTQYIMVIYKAGTDIPTRLSRAASDPIVWDLSVSKVCRGMTHVLTDSLVYFQ